MRILVTGGAGYVGSHLVRALLEAGHQVAVVDDLSSGHREAVPSEVALHVGRCGDHRVLEEAATDGAFDAVMHLAARCSVEEASRDPGLYYEINLVESVRLLDWVAARRIPWVIHSSTCAVYGDGRGEPLDEATCPRPTHAYGATKLAVDQALRCYAGAHGLRALALRYFNAAGARPDADLGEDKRPATNLIPRILDVALGLAPYVPIHGDDYPTPDGTPVRDYVHVVDLAEAHVAALDALSRGHLGGELNLGTGRGHTVLEVVAVAREVTGHPIPTRVGPRRPGDAAVLVANADRARRELGWEPRRSDLRTIVADAWRWRLRHPTGYRAARAQP